MNNTADIIEKDKYLHLANKYSFRVVRANNSPLFIVPIQRGNGHFKLLTQWQDNCFVCFTLIYMLVRDVLRGFQEVRDECAAVHRLHAFHWVIVQQGDRASQEWHYQQFDDEERSPANVGTAVGILPERGQVWDGVQIQSLPRIIFYGSVQHGI